MIIDMILYKIIQLSGENIQTIVEKNLNGQTIVPFARAYETTYQGQPETRIFLINGHKTKEGETRICS
ncbi:hypothetical protein L6452_30634 [Arctium lappa]|uniref:Uncharacterized protein n=1 Tax=Arctium lappa TaxID=4217 RepID=A0ACB8ZJN0_ARCLA|nr:hypothetical protein L6452_30634 [Arctium lappa]